MHDDFESCYRAVSSRDARFDGRFVTAVTSTGIYCRPSCAAQTPRRENARFYASAAAAVAAGFRACRRCRPEAAPGSPEWRARDDLVARALRAIAAGALDEQGVGTLAGSLGVSERHLHRMLIAAVGAGPLALARSRRAQTARLLLDATDLSVTTIAFASGFRSLRQFNDTMRDHFGTTPTRLRSLPRDPLASAGSLVLRLAYRRPLDADALFAWLGARAVPGLEETEGCRLRRALPGGLVVDLTPEPSGHVALRLDLSDVGQLAAAVAASRRLLDLDADPEAIDAALLSDPALASSLCAHPGLRVPGAVDGFELAVRAVLGQQVSVSAARTLAARLVATYGMPLRAPSGSVCAQFPTSAALAGADLAGIGLTAGRARALRALSRAHAAGELALDAGCGRADAMRRLLAVPGIGPWTASYIAMRALGDPDAYPAGDLVLRRAIARTGARPQCWRPWRAYGAMHLWVSEARGTRHGEARPERGRAAHPAALSD
jgi:AraC family transcriptional regulator of adaptative response / DNA-3-methyladenine glycosylase II